MLKPDEFGLCGEVRAAIVVVNGHMSGYELKSATDDLKRLPRQIIYYSKILDYCNLVVAESHFQDANKIVPDFWGVYIIKMNRKEWLLYENIDQQRLIMVILIHIPLSNYYGNLKYCKNLMNMVFLAKKHIR